MKRRAGWLAVLWCLSPLARAEPAAPSGGPADLSALVANAARAGERKVTIPPGVYRLAAPAKGRDCLTFSHLKGLEIDASGVELVCTDRVSRVLCFDHCEGVTLRGATVRHDPLPFSQGRIEEIAPDGSSADVRIAKGYPADLDDPRYFNNEGISFLNVFDPATRLWRREVPDVHYNRIERLGPGLFRFQAVHKLPPALRAGDLCAWRGRGAADVVLDGCKGMSLLDVRIVNGIGFCVHESGGEGGNFYRYTVTRGPAPAGATEPPLFACNADAFHSSGVRRGPTLEDCVFEYADDDGVPIHGSYALIAAVDGAASAFTLAAWDGDFCREGDELRVYDADGAFQGAARVRGFAPDTAFVPPAGFAASIDAFRRRPLKSFNRVTLDPALPVRPGWMVANADACGSGFVIRRCRIRHVRARGILVKASDGLIEDCLIEGTTMAGIALWPDLHDWAEADFSRRVTIRRNTLRRVGLWAEDWNPMAGALCIGDRENGRYAASPAGHREIVVEGNRFEQDDGPNILISTARDIRLLGNTFVGPMRQPSAWGRQAGVDPRSLVWITNAAGVLLRGNVVTDPGPYLKQEVTATASVEGLQTQAGFRTVTTATKNP